MIKTFNRIFFKKFVGFGETNFCIPSKLGRNYSTSFGIMEDIAEVVKKEV